MARPRANREEEATPRARRTPLGTPRLRMMADKRAGYVRRWVNDTRERIQDAIHAGYEFVHEPADPDRPETATDGQGTRICRTVGVQDDGTKLVAYLMEIPEKYYREDFAAKQAPLDEFDRSIHGGIVKGADPKDQKAQAFYVPKQGISFQN